MTPQKKTTIVADGLARIIASAQKPAIIGIVKPWLEQWQKVEDAAWEVTTLRYLDTAAGVQLDTLGVILGRARGNLGDDDYKIALRAEIIVNRSEGIPPQLEQLMVLCCPLPFELREYSVALLEFTLIGVIAFDLPTLWDILMRSKAAGVRLELTVDAGPDPDRQFFLAQDAADDDPTYDFAHGISSEYDTDRGGNLEHTQASA